MAILATTAAGTGLYVNLPGVVHPAPAAPCNSYAIYGYVYQVNSTGGRTLLSTANIWLNFTYTNGSGGPDSYVPQDHAGQYQFDLPCGYANGDALSLFAYRAGAYNDSVTNGTGTVNTADPGTEVDALLKAPALTATITAPTSPYQGEEWLWVNFTSTETGGSGGYSGKWIFGDGSKSLTYALANHTWTHIYEALGTYTATFVVEDSLGDIATSAAVTIDVVPAPSITSFTSNPTVLNNSQAVTFTTDISNGATPWTVTYAWGFGGPTYAHSVSTSPDTVTHYYQGEVSAIYAGTTASVSLVDAKSKTAGPVTTKLWIYNVSAHATLPILGGDYETDVNQVVDFTSSATGNAGLFNESWRFAQSGAAGTGASPTYTYTAAGTYTVDLWANDSTTAGKGNSVETTLVVKVNPALDAVLATNATGNDVDVGQATWFSGNSTTGGTGAPYPTYEFSYGDGAKTTGAAAGNSHKYSAVGTYYSWLDVTDATSSQNRSATVVVTVSADPTVSGVAENTSTRVATTEGYQGENLYFLATGAGGIGTLDYYFLFGDGGTSGATWQANDYAYHAYNATGTMTVTVEVKDAAGTFESSQFTLTLVSPLTLVSATTNLTAAGGEVSLSVTLTATIAHGVSTYTYDWTFGDSVGTVTTFSGAATSDSQLHTYLYPEVALANVTVTDSQGERVFAQLTIHVVPVLSAAPAPSATPANFDPPLNLTFVSGVAGGSGTIASYAWTLGNGNTSTAASPSQTYWNSGTYTVTLSVVDSYGDKAAGTYTFTVLGTATAYHLSAGWNLISLPGTSTNYDLWFLWEALVLKGAAPTTTAVTIQNTAGGTPLNYTFQDGVGPDSAANEAVGNARGIWIEVAASVWVGLSAVGNAGPLGAITLQTGWNNLGWALDGGSASTTAAAIASSITGAEDVSVWSASAQTYTTYIVGFDTTSSPEDVTITTGEGFLVWVSGPTTYAE